MISISDTVLAGLVGGAVASLIAGIVNVAVENKRHAGAMALEEAKRVEERRKDDLRFRRERLIEPLIAFTDDFLGCVSQYYWNAADRAARKEGEAYDKDAELRLLEDVQARLLALRNREGSAEARIRALGQPGLLDVYRQLSKHIWLVRRVEALGAARDEVEKASKLGGELLAALCKVEEKSGS